MLQNRTCKGEVILEKEKLFLREKASWIFNLLLIYPHFPSLPPHTHTNILAVLCLTGATAESIIQPVSKTSHHISAEGGKKKRLCTISKPIWQLELYWESVWENAATKLTSRVAVKFSMLAAQRGWQVLNNQDILSPVPTVDTAGHVWVCTTNTAACPTKTAMARAAG